jgi:hypothetical protein
VAIVALAQPMFAADVIVDPIHEYRDEVERGEFQYDDSDDIPWIENETKVLGLPNPDNLMVVNLDQLPRGMTLMLDESSISVNEEDRVVRVWLWVRTGSGADNASFEGFRCDTREYKVYAYGNPRRTPPVTKAKRPRWREAKKLPSGNYRRELMDFYFCGFNEIRNASDIVGYLTGGYRPDLISTD